MNILDKEINKKICIKYLLGVLVFTIVFIVLLAVEMLFPKSFNVAKYSDNIIEDNENPEYVTNIEGLNKNKMKLSISGYAFKGSDAIERYNSYFILKNKETGKMYKLKTKMEQRGNFKGTGIEFCGMHSQTITVFMQNGNYELYIWYGNNDDNKLLKTNKEVEI